MNFLLVLFALPALTVASHEFFGRSHVQPSPTQYMPRDAYFRFVEGWPTKSPPTQRPNYQEYAPWKRESDLGEGLFQFFRPATRTPFNKHYGKNGFERKQTEWPSYMSTRPSSNKDPLLDLLMKWGQPQRQSTNQRTRLTDRWPKERRWPGLQDHSGFSSDFLDQSRLKQKLLTLRDLLSKSRQTRWPRHWTTTGLGSGQNDFFRMFDYLGVNSETQLAPTNTKPRFRTWEVESFFDLLSEDELKYLVEILGWYDAILDNHRKSPTPRITTTIKPLKRATIAQAMGLFDSWGKWQRRWTWQTEGINSNEEDTLDENYRKQSTLATTRPPQFFTPLPNRKMPPASSTLTRTTPTKSPPTTTKSPATTIKPATTTTAPTSTITKPTATTTVPQTTTRVPQTTTTITQTTTTTIPPKTTTTPPITTTIPKTTTTIPQTTTTMPPITTTIPPTTTTIPPTTTKIPPATTTIPPTTTTEPTTTTMPPTTTPISLTTMTIQPTITTIPPATTTKPPATTTAPSTTPTIPSSTTISTTPDDAINDVVSGNIAGWQPAIISENDLSNIPDQIIIVE